MGPRINSMASLSDMPFTGWLSSLRIMSPVWMPASSAGVSSIGRLLCFEMDELPELAKGKGVKLINIPTKKYKEGEEKLVAAAVVPEDGNLQVYCGVRMMTIKWDDTDKYYGERALRGSMLPRGWRNVDRLVGVAAE